MLPLQTDNQMPTNDLCMSSVALVRSCTHPMVTASQGQLLQFHCTTSTDYAFACAPSTIHPLIPSPELSPADFDTPTIYQYSEVSSPSDSLPPSPIYEDYPATQYLRAAKAPSRLRSGNRVPRPRNAFMIFRSEFWSESKISKSVEHDHRHISRIIGHCWNQLPEEEKDVWRRRAEQEKIEHNKKYPGYRFSPNARTKQVVRRNVKRNGEDELLRCKQVAELLLAGKAGTELDHAVKSIDSISGREISPPLPSKKMAVCALSDRNDAPVFRSPLLPPAEDFPCRVPPSSKSQNDYPVEPSSDDQGWTPRYATPQIDGRREASYTSQYLLQHQPPPTWVSQQEPSNLSYATPVDVFQEAHSADASYRAHPHSLPFHIEFINPFSYHVDSSQGVAQANTIQPPVDPLHWNLSGHGGN